MTDIILGGPPIPLYEIDNLIPQINEYDNQIYDIINLLSSQYEISPEKIRKIYDTFVNITGFDQTFITNNADIIRDTQISLTNANTLYVSLLFGITLIIIIWALCIMGLYSWIIALIVTLIIIFFIVILGFAYRAKSDNIINEEFSKLKDESQQTLENLKNSISYLPKGLYESLLTIINEPDNLVINDAIINNVEVKKGCGCGK